MLCRWMPELGHIEHRHAASLLGVVPVAKDSGKSFGARHIRGGRLLSAPSAHWKEEVRDLQGLTCLALTAGRKSMGSRLPQYCVSTRIPVRPGQGYPDLSLWGLSRDVVFFLVKRLPQYVHS